MSRLNGFTVKFITQETGLAGTDDHVYLGLSGTAGGCEFALATDEFDDFQGDTDEEMDKELGLDPDDEPDFAEYGVGVGSGFEPATAGEQLESMFIDQPDITHVYIRKQGDRSYDEDNQWNLFQAYVQLFAEDDPKRYFLAYGLAGNPLKLGNQYGLQVWLREYDLSPELAEVGATDPLPELKFDHESRSVTPA